MEDLRVPRVQKNLVEILTEDEIKALLACLDPNTATGARAHAIVWTFLDTGLRCGELVGLKLADPHLHEGHYSASPGGSSG